MKTLNIKAWHGGRYQPICATELRERLVDSHVSFYVSSLCLGRRTQVRKMSRQEGCSEAAKEIFTVLTKSQASVVSRFVKHAGILKPKRKFTLT